MTKERHVVLTAREREIARAVAAGLANRQIAERLGVSEKTVRNQMTVLFEKFSVRGRLQLAVFLHAHPAALEGGD